MERCGFKYGEWSDLWYRYDADNSGRITEKEFVRMFTDVFYLKI